MRKSVAVMLVLVFSSALLIVAANPAGATTTENSWTTMADMPTSRLGPGVAVVNGKIYVIGGTGGGGYLNTNEEYDPATNTWVTKKAMPTPRANFAIAVYKNKIYCIGGGPGNDWTVGFDEVTRMNEVYDPLTDTWETKTPMPTARQFLCANVVGGKIYLIGGSKPVNLIDPSYVPNVNEVYDPETDKWTTDPPPTTLPRVNTDTGTTSHTWTTKTPPPVNVSNYASAVVDNKIYIISGSGSNNELTLIYDTETDSWSYGAQIPTPVWGAAAGVTSGVLAPKRIYVIGGYPAFNQVQIYDPETDTWTTGANMPTNRYGLGVAVVDDILYAIGGGSKKNERYTPFGFGAIPPPIDQHGSPAVYIFSPENKTYASSNISLVFTVNKPTSWLGYSLDGQDNVTFGGNTTLSGLPNGSHNLTVYATDQYGNTGASETVYFNVEVPFPTTLVAAASIATITVVVAVLLVYFKKRNLKLVKKS